MNDDNDFQINWINSHPCSPEEKFSGKNEDENKDIKNHSHKSKKHDLKKRWFLEAEVDEEIDLHGEAIEDGIFKMEQLIMRAIEYKYKKIRIIHGFGNSTAPTLRSKCKYWQIS